MSEDDAKTKWCPMVRVASSKDPGAAAINTPIARRKIGASSGEWCRCIASACMMWREYGPFSAGYKPNPPKVGGYCGLGGEA